MHVMVLRNHRARGLEVVHGLYSGLGADGDLVYSIAQLWSLDDALAEQFDSQTALVCYTLKDQDGDPVANAPRINKPALNQIREMGGEVSCSILCLDLDFKKKAAWEDLHDPEAMKQELLAFSPSIGRPSVVYSTPHGARFIHRLAFDVPAGPSFEDLVRRFMASYKEGGLEVDSKCCDWTRLFFAPQIVKNDQALWEQPWFFCVNRPDEFYIPEKEDLIVKEETAIPAIGLAEGECLADDEAHTLFEEKSSLIAGVFSPTHPSYGLVFLSRSLEGEGEKEGHNSALLAFVGSVCRSLVPCGWASVEVAYAVVMQQARLLKPTAKHPDWASVAWKMVQRTWSKELASREKKQAGLSEEVEAKEEVGGLLVERRYFDEVGNRVPSEPENLDLVLDSETGKPLKTRENVRRALHQIGMVPEYDSLKMHEQLRIHTRNGDLLKDLVSSALLSLRFRAEEVGPSIGKTSFEDLVFAYAHARQFHPVRDYLDSLEWDGTPRIDNWLIHYMGADPKNGCEEMSRVDEEQSVRYMQAIGAIWMIAAVRRARTPGCKFDELLVFEGPQGGFKSTAVRILAVNDDWFSDFLPIGANPREVIECTAGRWIIESGEMMGQKRSSAEDVKNFQSRSYDTARMSYDRTVTTRPRQFVVIATTNQPQYLKDNTGNRRFWPVRVGDVKIDELRRDVHQLWAEAAHREAKGESIVLDPKFYPVEGLHQAEREMADPFLEEMERFGLADLEGRIRVSEIHKMMGISDASKRSQPDGVRIRLCMEKMGWVKKVFKIGGKASKGYVKGTDRTVWKVNPQGTKLIPDKSAE